MSTKKNAVTINRDPKIEKLLDEHGISYTYEAMVPLSDLERHADAQSRLGTVKQADVRGYAEQMKQGAIFPPVVLWEDSVEGWVIVDGNTRVLAKRKNKATHTDAYVVDLSTSAEAIVVSAIFNGTNGQPLSTSEIKRAILANEKMGTKRYSAKRLAKDYGVSAAYVSKIINVARAKDDLVALGVDVNALHDSALDKIGKITDDAVKRDLANLAIDAKLSQPDLAAVVRDVKAKGAEADRLKVVSDSRTEQARRIEDVKQGRAVSGNPAATAAMVMGRLNKAIETHPDAETWVPVKAEARQNVRTLASDLSDFLSKIVAAIDAAPAPIDAPEEADAA